MSAGGAFGGNRGARPVPPEKGVFPLDHLHLCDVEKKDYISCLKSSGHKSDLCRHLSRMYLECRMKNFLNDYSMRRRKTYRVCSRCDSKGNLMAKQDMSELGFGKEPVLEASTDKITNEMIEE